MKYKSSNRTIFTPILVNPEAQANNLITIFHVFRLILTEY